MQFQARPAGFELDSARRRLYSHGARRGLGVVERGVGRQIRDQVNHPRPRFPPSAGGEDLKTNAALDHGGIEYEADARHHTIVIEELGLSDCGTVSTPYGPEEAKVSDEPGEPLEAGEATRYRALVARLNYLALDRPDIQFGVKDAAKEMSAPSAPGWKLLKRLGGVP